MSRPISPIRAVPAMLALLVFTSGAAAEVLAQREARDDEYAVNDLRVQHRSYVMEETGETIPYALFVPSSYDSSTPSPLMVSLHGAGRQFDWLMNYAGFLDLADERGYVVVTPLGYTRRGGYGYRGDSDQDRRAEQDVMNVLELVTSELNIDENRIYLWGHSMGGAGTYYIASRYPEIWAGLAAVAGGRMTADYVDEQAIRHIPFLVIQGSDDQTVPAAGSRASVARMRELGMQHLYVEIPGGDHSLFISRNPDVVEHLFFVLRHRLQEGGRRMKTRYTTLLLLAVCASAVPLTHRSNLRPATPGRGKSPRRATAIRIFRGTGRTCRSPPFEREKRVGVRCSLRRKSRGWSGDQERAPPSQGRSSAEGTTTEATSP